MKKNCLPAVILVVLGVSWVTSVADKPGDSQKVEILKTGDEVRYAPGLGEIMTMTQMRHSKLWFAGLAGNWKLAEYEVKELQEGFDDTMKYHSDRSELLPKMTGEVMNRLRIAVSKKDKQQFKNAYDGLTNCCNACHEATEFGFNKVITPKVNPFPNQDFSPH